MKPVVNHTPFSLSDKLATNPGGSKEKEKGFCVFHPIREFFSVFLFYVLIWYSKIVRFEIVLCSSVKAFALRRWRVGGRRCCFPYSLRCTRARVRGRPSFFLPGPFLYALDGCRGKKALRADCSSYFNQPIWMPVGSVSDCVLFACRG